MRAILLLDKSGQLAAWQHEALRIAIEQGLVITQIAYCVDTPPIKLTQKNFAYYIFAYASRRGLVTTDRKSVEDLVEAGVKRVSFRAIHEGAWQRIPSTVAEGFAGSDVLIKFGMTLLRGSDDLPLKYGVLSYHHGDPEHYRGRPAGYYELLQGENVQGVIVQRLSDTLDGGKVLAKSFSRVIPYSYGQTLQAAQRAGVPLLASAIRLLDRHDSEFEPPASLGPNYRLPSTKNVIRQARGILSRKVARVVYGLLREKRWQVSQIPLTLNPEVETVIPSEQLRPFRLPKGYVFAADPCADEADSFYAELLNGRTGLGEIARWQNNGAWTLGVLDRIGHASYPQSVTVGEDRYLFPEVASSSCPRLFRMSSDGLARGEGRPLRGLESDRLVDATLFRSGDGWYLFAGTPVTASGQLNLWYADELFGPYRLHPSSPICIDPRGARMAGSIAEMGGYLYRFGQDCSVNYGGRVRIHRIDDLSRESYTESVTGSIRLTDHWGPHTVNVTDGGMLIDFFAEHTTLAAGLRRLRAKFVARRSRSRL